MRRGRTASQRLGNGDEPFQEMLKKLGIETFGEKGDTFDPNIHHAIMHEDNENLPENSIVEVFQRGYKKGGAHHSLRHGESCQLVFALYRFLSVRKLLRTGIQVCFAYVRDMLHKM